MRWFVISIYLISSSSSSFQLILTGRSIVRYLYDCCCHILCSMVNLIVINDNCPSVDFPSLSIDNYFNLIDELSLLCCFFLFNFIIQRILSVLDMKMNNNKSDVVTDKITWIIICSISCWLGKLLSFNRILLKELKLVFVYFISLFF